MKRVAVILGCFVVAVIIGVCVPVPDFLRSPYKGEVVETWEKADTPFPIRVDKHIERGGFAAALGGAYYVFQAGSRSGWHEIMTVRHDDPNEIPRDHVRFAGDRVAYFYMGSNYAVTTDGGESWHVRDICDRLLTKERCLAVAELSIDAQGRGEIRVETAVSANNPKVMSTPDFGLTWRDQ
jgi:hypothetical protein